MSSEAKTSVFGSCRSTAEFEILNRIGQGTYGLVYRAKDNKSGEIVALKQVILHGEKQDGFPITSIREIKILKQMKHPNIVGLREMAVGKKRDKVYMVFEYCDHDLGALIDTMHKQFSESEAKSLLQQLLSAVDYMHSKWYIHRDLKMTNLLYTRYGQLKLADFGLARTFEWPVVPMTPEVVTLWYRPPELLLGCKEYTTAIDMWGVGCVFAEFIVGKPIFQGSTPAEQLRQISMIIGAPKLSEWPELSKLPLYNDYARRLPDVPSSRLGQLVPNQTPVALDLLRGLLCWNPEKRLSAAQALKHPYFTERPLPRELHLMPSFPSLHLKPGYRGLGVGGRNLNNNKSSPSTHTERKGPTQQQSVPSMLPMRRGGRQTGDNRPQKRSNAAPMMMRRNNLGNVF